MTDVEANDRLLNSVAQTWEWADGPAKAGFMTGGERVSYFSLGPGAVGEAGTRHGYFGCRNLEQIISWYPDLVDQVAESSNRVMLTDISPSTHKIVWRSRPETYFSEDEGRWRIYSRLAFVPKTAEIGEGVN